MKRRLQEEGFSLIELLIAASMLAGLLMGAMTYMKKRTSEAKYLESVGEADSTVNRIRLYLLDKDACFSTLQGLKIPSSPNTPLNISVIKDKNGNAVPTLAANPLNPGEIQRDLLRITKMELYNTGSVPANGYGQTEIRIHMLRNKSRAVGVDDVVRKLYISVATDSAMKVTKCFSSTENAIESAYKLACKDSGGKYDDNTGLCNFFPLANGQHNYNQCTSIGGTVVTAGAVEICKLPVTSDDVPPAKGWTPYNNWTTTQPVTPTDADCNNRDQVVTADNISDVIANPTAYQRYNAKLGNMGNCPTGSHAWSDKPIETCSVTCSESNSPCQGESGACRSFSKNYSATPVERGFY